MSFRHPWLLLLLLLVPLWAWWRARTRRGRTFPFSDGPTLDALPRTWGVQVHRFIPVLFGLAAACLVVALSGPRRGLAESRVNTEAVDVVLLADVSTSMMAEDFSTEKTRMNRLDAAKRVMADFIQSRRDDRIGLIIFSAMPYTMAPLTLDHGWLLQRMQDAKIGMVEDGTAIGSALASAVNRLRKSEAKSKLVVLLTDGVNNRGTITPENAAEAAKAMGIRVYTVGAGARGTAPVPVNDPFFGRRVINQPVEIDEERLQRIADATGGKYFRATDFESLKKVYEEIDRLEKTEIEVEQFTRYEDLFAPWALAGLVLLLVERSLSVSRFGGLPS